jgi:hypothetical protein
MQFSCSTLHVGQPLLKPLGQQAQFVGLELVNRLDDCCERHPQLYLNLFRRVFDHPMVVGISFSRLEQTHKSGLLEVVVGGERFDNAAFLHYDETDSIHQRPLLVGS